MKIHSLIYIKTLGIIFSCYFVLSLIMAVLLAFIQLPTVAYIILSQLLSSLVVMLSSLYFYRKISSNILLHSVFFVLIYLLVTLTLQFDHLSVFTLVLRPVSFLIPITLLTYLSHKKMH